MIPLFNESENIQTLIEAIEKSLSNLAIEKEIILVDDGSTDNTWQEISKASTHHRSLLGIKLSRNFGHQHALLAGLSSAKGEYIITMDGDLQHPPELIPEMIKAHQEGFKIIATKRKDSTQTSFFKKVTSAFFYRVFKFFTNINIQSGSSDFRSMHIVQVKQLLSFNDVDLFLRERRNGCGYNTKTISCQANDRHRGKTKYSLMRMLRFAKGSIISFQDRLSLVFG